MAASSGPEGSSWWPPAADRAAEAMPPSNAWPPHSVCTTCLYNLLLSEKLSGMGWSLIQNRE